MNTVTSLQFSGTTPGTSMTEYERQTIQVRILGGKSLDDVALEFPGDRLVRLGWKGNKDTGRIAHAARYVSIPVVEFSLEGADRKFLPMLQEAFDTAQKEMIHRAVTELLDSKREVTALSARDFTKDKVLVDWEAQDTGKDSSRGKLSAEAIGVWFDKSLNDTLVEALAVKSGKGDEMTESDLEAFQRAASQYRKIMMMLASPKPQVTIEVAGNLKKAVSLLGEEGQVVDTTLGKILRKIEVILNPIGVEDAMMAL